MSYSFDYAVICACFWAGYELETFRGLSGTQQSEIVAAWESHNQIDAVLTEAAYAKKD